VDIEVSLVSLSDGGDGPWAAESDSAVAGGTVGGVGAVVTGADVLGAGVTPVGYPAPLVPDPTGLAATPPPEPGVYRFEISDRASGAPLANGVVEVERWTPSLKLPPLDPPSELLGLDSSDGVGAAGGGRPLRTHPLPFLFLLLVLCAEWMGRRRLGLR
jgi:hypothetical protein